MYVEIHSHLPAKNGYLDLRMRINFINLTLNDCNVVQFKDRNFLTLVLISGSSSVGRALASQAKGRGFESLLPLIYNLPPTV